MLNHKIDSPTLLTMQALYIALCPHVLHGYRENIPILFSCRMVGSAIRQTLIGINLLLPVCHLWTPALFHLLDD
jgi:hypothetical protein